MMNRKITRPVHHFRGTGRTVNKAPVAQKKVNSPTKKQGGARLNHNSPYPFYFYKRLIFGANETLKTINIPMRMGEAVVLKSATIHYGDSAMIPNNTHGFDSYPFNRDIKTELYKIENNRVTSNKPLPVELYCQIGKYGVQICNSISISDVEKSNFRGYQVAPVSPFLKPEWDIKKGNVMALDELIPSNGNLFMNVYCSISNPSYIPPSNMPIVPMAVDIILKAVCVPSLSTFQKAY